MHLPWLKHELIMNNFRNQMLNGVKNLTLWVKKHVTFYRLHMMYFLGFAILGSVLFWVPLGSHNAGLKPLEAMYYAVSSVTTSGLSSLQMTEISIFHKIVMLFLISLGSPVMTSLLPVYVRRFYFRRHLQTARGALKDHKTKSSMSNNQISKRGVPADKEVAAFSVDFQNIAYESSVLHSSEFHRCQGEEHMQTVGPEAEVSEGIGIVGVLQEKTGQFDGLSIDIPRVHKMNYESMTGKSDGLSIDIPRVHNLNHESMTGRDDKEPKDQELRDSELETVICPHSPSLVLRTVEYQALVFLCNIVTLYTVLVQIFGAIAGELCFLRYKHAQEVLRKDNVDQRFFSLFASVSAFTNAGFGLLNESMIPFQKFPGLLIVYPLISLLGNNLFPLVMRLLIWILHKLADEKRKPVYKFLLEHPRRVFTHMFPYSQSVWLLLTVIGFTIVQFCFLCILDWNSEAFSGLSIVEMVSNGFYQSVSTRNAGGSVANLRQLGSPMLLIYCCMMYVAAYPVFLSRQKTTEVTLLDDKHYNESEIAIFNKMWDLEMNDRSLTFQSRKLLARDSLLLICFVFLACVFENEKIENDPFNYSVFYIIFEVISAYGNIGLSVGYDCSVRIPKGRYLPPCQDAGYSFSGKWSTKGKLLIILAMFIGRHRGLPENIDSAIRLPTSDAHSRNEASIRIRNLNQPIVSRTTSRN